MSGEPGVEEGPEMLLLPCKNEREKRVPTLEAGSGISLISLVNFCLHLVVSHLRKPKKTQHVPKIHQTCQTVRSLVRREGEGNYSHSISAYSLCLSVSAL